MDIMLTLCALLVAWTLYIPLIAPYYVQTLGPACLAEFGRSSFVLGLFTFMGAAVIYAVWECQAFLVESWPVLQMAWYHRFRPADTCPNWNCPRCYVHGLGALYEPQEVTE